MGRVPVDGVHHIVFSLYKKADGIQSSLNELVGLWLGIFQNDDTLDYVKRSHIA